MALTLWRGLLAALAAAAGAIIGAMFIVIVVDVTLRAVGLQPPLWTGALTEFGLLYVALLAAPWLIARDGHIRVRAFTDRLPAHIGRRLERVVFALLAALCALLSVYALNVTLDTAARGELEYRSIILPRWTLFAPIAPGFALCAVEFVRLALNGLTDRSGKEDVEHGW